MLDAPAVASKANPPALFTNILFLMSTFPYNVEVEPVKYNALVFVGEPLLT